MLRVEDIAVGLALQLCSWAQRQAGGSPAGGGDPRHSGAAVTMGRAALDLGVPQGQRGTVTPIENAALQWFEVMREGSRQ